MQDPIVAFSHLRWDFVWQRPQHVLSRLAARHGRPVIFIEEPVREEAGSPFWEKRYAQPGVLVCRPHTAVEEAGFSAKQVPELRGMVASLLKEETSGRCDTWFYTPMAVPVLDALDARIVVYDAMDELAGFRFAPPELPAREEELLRAAHVVFTGGPSLYRARKSRHHNVHCFPSSVDREHFGRARSAMPDPEPQRDLPRPRLGFFGVIDERMDLGLLDAIARSHPEWNVVMLGPVVKIDPSELPRHPNIHWLGHQPYEALPAFLANWDICLMPFALNGATRFISPTKTLEYMAGGRMIVSTPVADVAEPYGRIVYLGSAPGEFITACERALAASPEEQTEVLHAMDAVLAQTSWDATVASMHTLIERARRSPRGPAVRRPVVIAGAGPTGLSAAYHLGEDALLIEREDRVGGWCRSIEAGNFTFDHAGHIMFSADEYVHGMYRMLLGDNIHWQDREAWVYTHGVYTRYPFQGALYGLPSDVIKECLVGAIEARYGALRPETPGGRPVEDCCGDGILEAEARLGAPACGAHPRTEPRNFEEFIYRVWGAGIAKHFAIPYNRKLWCIPLSDIETSWLGGRVPLPDIEEMIEGALNPAIKPVGPNARFGYPLRGGFQALMNGFMPHLKGGLRLGSAIVAVSPRRRAITLAGGSEIAFDHLISTIPLPVLVRMMGDEAPPAIRAAAESLRHVSIRCVNLGVGRPALTNRHWIYFPGDTIFHRVFAQGNMSPYCNPPGGFGLVCEISYAPEKPLPFQGQALIERCVADCRRVGLLSADDPIRVAFEVDLPYAYVVYDHGRAANVALIREWLEARGVLLAGRYSEWEYYNSDHAFLAGKRAAERVRQSRSRPEDLARLSAA